jgi:hypothetical protein
VYSIIGHIRRNLPIILVIVFLLITSSCRYVKKRLKIGEYSLKRAIEWAKQDSARIADSLNIGIVDKEDSGQTLPDSMKRVLSEKKVFESTLTDTLLSIAGEGLTQESNTPTYHIIIGSYSNHDFAKKYARKYSVQGFKTKIIKSTDRKGVSMELVSVKTFSDHDKAALFLKEFKSKYYENAWIYKEK